MVTEFWKCAHMVSTWVKQWIATEVTLGHVILDDVWGRSGGVTCLIELHLTNRSQSRHTSLQTVYLVMFDISVYARILYIYIISTTRIYSWAAMTFANYIFANSHGSLVPLTRRYCKVQEHHQHGHALLLRLSCSVVGMMHSFILLKPISGPRCRHGVSSTLDHPISTRSACCCSENQ
jgi:hypothetical protein